jgi:hypothetical protein
MRLPLLAALLIGAAAAAPLPRSMPPPLCRVVVYRDYDFALGTYWTPRLAPGCPPDGIGRLRKSSTLNTKAQGAAFQPIRPAHGAWTVTSSGDDVPNSEQTSYFWSTWEWQDYEKTGWQKAETR